MEELLIGHEPSISYAYKILHIVNKGARTVLLKSRGKAIEVAVNTAEITKRLVADKFKVTATCSIGTDSFEKDSKTIFVSFMEVKLDFE